MRLPLRSLGTLLLAVAVATCSDTPNAVVKTAPEGRPGVGRFAISPRFSPQAAAVYAQRATFAAANFDRVRILITRPPNEVVIDTVVTFNPSSPTLTLDLFVDVKTTNEIFDGAIQYTNNGTVVYEAKGKVQSYPPDQLAPTPQELVAVYVGPGANATRLTITPQSSNITSPGGASFTATAFDANNAPVTNVPITWAVSDATVATLGAREGASTSITTTGKRGSITVTAQTPTLSASATVNVTLPPAAIALVSGGGQTGKAGTALANPAVVRVTASDGIGVQGVSVQFAAPNGGGVGSTSTTTDAQGQASSSLTLGGAIGPQSFAASAAGFSVSIPATATPGDPSAIAIVSGSGQIDTVNRPLRAPFVVKVSDRFGNGVGNVTVTWAKTSGAGSLGGTTSVTGADGNASMTYTLGATAGAEAVTATAAGVATSVTFSATAITGPANIAAVSGTGQTGRVGQPLAAPFVVRVTDVAGNPVSGAVVTWAATNGSVSGGSSTDAQGQASATFTLGTTVGGATATASVNTINGVRSATFSATVQAGVVARAVFRVGPTNVAAGAVMAPSVQVELQDAGGNRTNAVNPVSIAIGTNPGQATLGGTLTRNAVAGVATFDDLTLSAAGTGYTLVASSGGVPNITSAAFDVTASGQVVRILFVDEETLTALPTQPPPSVTMTAGTFPTNPPAIRVVDGQGAPIANASVVATVRRGAQTLFTTVPTTNQQGVIAFSSLAVSPNNLQVAGNYTFTATLAGATGSPLTLPVTVEPAAPTQYILSASTTTPAAGAQSTITAQLADQFDNFVPEAGRTVSWALSGSGGGSLDRTNSTTNAQGQAAIVYTAPAQPSGATVTVSATSAEPSITGSVTLTPQQVPVGPPAMLSITTQPSTTAISNQPLSQQPVVQVWDANGNLVPTPTPITVTASWSAGSTSNGVIQTNSAGVATFTSLAVVGAGAASIVFSAPGLTSATSAVVTSVVPATALQYIVAPSNVVQGGVISPAVQLRVVDANNTPVPSYSGTATVAIGTNPASGTLAGTLSVPITNGIATFSNLSINNAGNGYTLVVSSTGLSSATSPAFNVLLPPDALTIATAPSSVTNGEPVSPQPVVRLTRSGSNVPLAGVTVTASIAPTNSSSLNPIDQPRLDAVRRGRAAMRASASARPPLTVTNATAVTDANGVATFTNLTVNGMGYYFRLAFDASGPGFAVTDTTADLFLEPGPAAGLMIVAGDNQTGPAGAPLPDDVVVVLVDAGGNIVSSPPTTVTFATNDGSVSPTTFTIDAQSEGFAWATWTMPATPGPATLTASATINGQPVSVTFHATATAALLGSITPVTPVNVLSVGATPIASNYPAVVVRDGSSNPVANVSVLWTGTNTAGCTAAGGSSVTVNTDANGVSALSSANTTIHTSGPGSCLAIATLQNGQSATMSVVVAPAGVATWIGATSTAWNVGSNWHGGSVPTSTDQIFVPGWLANRPALTGATTIAALTGEDNSSPAIDLGNFQLTVNGNFRGQSPLASTTGSGSVLLNAPGAATVNGYVQAPLTIGATTCTSSYTVPSAFVLTTTGDLTVNCPISTGALAGIVVGGNAAIQGANGRLIMNTGSSSYFSVSGNITFDGASESGFLTAGTIVPSGNLIVGSTHGPNAFAAANEVIFAGNPDGHTITIASGATGTSFGGLYVYDGTVTVAGTGNLTTGGLLVGSGGALVTSGTITTAGALGQSLGSYAGVNQLVVTGGTFPEIDGAAPALTILTGSTIAPFANNTFGGSVEVRGRLNVTSDITIGGNLSVTGANGEISMNDPARTLTVNGNVTFAGRQSTLLTAGRLVAKGNFTQLSTVSAGSYRPAAAFVTRFDPAGIRTVNFAAPDSGSSFLGIVEVGSNGGVDFASRIITFGNFTNGGQVQFLGGQPASRIGGSMFFLDPSRTVIQSGAFLQIFGVATYPASPQNVILQLLGGMQAGSCSGAPSSGPNICS